MILDASVALRYLTGDDPSKEARCGRLFQTIAKDQQRVLVTSLCLAEVAWVLDRLYRYPRAMIVIALRRLIHTAGMEVVEQEVWVEAIEIYENSRMSPIDAYHAAFMSVHGIHSIFSYDTDFDGLPGVTRREP